jgi:hypothetical protein
MPISVQPRRFTIALSFPGEHRDVIEPVAKLLADKLSTDRVLYDHYHKPEFARLDLDVYLPGLYRTESELIVLLLCPEYTQKRWCKLEWRHIRQLIATAESERIMFLSVGDPGDLSEAGILSGDGYIDISDVDPREVADDILKRLRFNIHGPNTPPDTPPDIPVDVDRIDRYAPDELIGREAETKVLEDSRLSLRESVARWSPPRVHGGDRRATIDPQPVRESSDIKATNVLTFVALGGEGKTALVARWVAGLAAADWPECDAAFGWSFYSQGSSDASAASSDAFLDAALRFLGDTAMADSSQSAVDKARRVAELAGSRRTLLVLDGLEPLQYPPDSPLAGRLKDVAMVRLLKGLAARNHGLCVVTTRYSLPDLQNYRDTTAPEFELKRLSAEAGVALLQSLEVQGRRQEFDALVEEVQGHALTLQIMGQYLRRAHHGDIRRRDRVRFEQADAKVQGGHAFRAMAAYESWLDDEGEEGRRELSILRLTGLFDRPADAGCLRALCDEPIAGLTESLSGLSEEDWDFSLSNLESARLILVNRDDAGRLASIDAHPLVREYFKERLKAEDKRLKDGDDSSFCLPPSAFREAHRRLYEHLTSTPDVDQPTLDDLAPLYQAVAHGCLAGLHERAMYDVYHARIKRRDENHSSKKLGAMGSDLGAVACFFDAPWSRLSPALSEPAQAWLLNEAALRLRALGRLTEALEPMRVSGEMDVKVEEWNGAARSHGNLSELELTLGEVSGAVDRGAQSVTYADRSGDAFLRVVMRTAHADALHEAGRRREAEALFVEAESQQAAFQPAYPRLYSLGGFRYCDLLLAEMEIEAWKKLTRAKTPRKGS